MNSAAQAPEPAGQEDRSPSDPVPKSHQELTLSYLCDSASKQEPHHPLPDPPPPAPSKGKELAPNSPPPPAAAAAADSPPWIERDFLQLSSQPNTKRELLQDPPHDPDVQEKRPKIESLNLSLAPPVLSLSLDPPLLPKNPNARNHDHAPLPTLQNRTFSGNAVPPHILRMASASEDYSCSMSVPFSHNPSCSLTRNSTENYESEQFWYCGGGEGTNGSVHSRFRPIIAGDGNGNGNNKVTFTNFGNKESSNGIGRGNGSESHSFFPSELPARMMRANCNVSLDSGRNMVAARPERVLREIMSESVSLAAQILHEMPNESLEMVKDYLRCLVASVERKEEFLTMQRRLERRSDLSAELLVKGHRVQLEVLATIKTGVVDFLSSKNRLSNTELVEVFLLTRCRNMSCKNVLPVDDCDCKICSSKKGFCSACMCPVCFNFDCAANTCSWVGCDVCSHWCHAVCGIQKNLIKPGPSLKRAIGTTEMQFHCLGCGHASEMFGFVKEVFTCCAKDWSLETLIKELDCVRNIFQGSEDFEGKSLQGKAEEMLSMLGKKLISPADACSGMLQFFKYGVADHSVTGGSSKSSVLTAAQACQKANTLPHHPPTAPVLPQKAAFSLKPSISLLDTQIDTAKVDTKIPVPEPHFGLLKKEEGGGLQSLESMVHFKEAEAKLFQRLSDDARREIESYRQIARSKAEKLEEEYGSKLARLCLQETEERRRRKLEELKFLENSHCDYQNMKLRMQADIASLLQQMEATKKQWAM